MYSIAYRWWYPVVDPDLQIRGGAGHPDPEIRWAPGPLGFILVKK